MRLLYEIGWRSVIYSGLPKIPRDSLKNITLIQSALRKLNQEILLFFLIENLKVRSLRYQNK